MTNTNVAQDVSCASAKACFELGMAAAKGDRNRAIGAYSQSITFDPKNADSYNNRGNIYADQENWDRAIEDFSRAIELIPTDPEFHYNRAHVFGETFDRDRAIADYSEAIRLNPDYNSGLFQSSG